MDYLHPYIPIGMIIVGATAFATITLVLGRVLGPQRPNPSKQLPYESGMIPTGEANVQVPIKFHMVALLFLLFDIEAVFLLMWAVVFRGNHPAIVSGAVNFTAQDFQRFAFVEMLVFMAILMVGFTYVWRKGGLEWS